MNKLTIRRSGRASLLIAKRSSAVWAGQHIAQRNTWLNRARCTQDKGLRKLFVDFARDQHHDYLRALTYMQEDEDTNAAQWRQIEESERQLREEFRDFLTPKDVNERVRNYNKQVQDLVFKAVFK